MTDELRLKLDQESRKSEQIVLDNLVTCVHMLHDMKATRGDVDGRGISIAITHIQTAALWIEDSTKVEAE